MPSELQEKFLNSMNDGSDEDGLLSKLWGKNKELIAMYITFLLCLLLAIVGCICMHAGKDYWNVILPAILTGMGYLFGKGDK